MIGQEFFRHVEMLMGRGAGPFNLRLILQPTVAVILASRAGLRDAREGRPAYFLWAVFTHPARRPEHTRLAWKDVGKVFIVALVLDVIYELIVYRWVYPGQALIVAVILAIIPYLLVRGPVTRLARRFIRRSNNELHDQTN